MASERLETAEKIVRMTEWNEAEPWEYAEGEVANVDTLAAAKRFVSAQSFLLSWQEGKVPTGWRRPRKLTDFDGKYAQSVIDEAENIIAERIEMRNMQKTAKINAAISAAAKAISATGKLRDGVGGVGGGGGAREGVSTGFGVVLTSAKTDKKGGGGRERGGGGRKKLSRSELEAVKKDLGKFNDELFEGKNALRTAMNAAADISMRVDALSKVISQPY